MSGGIFSRKKGKSVKEGKGHRKQGIIRAGKLSGQGARESQQDAFCVAGEECPECGILAVVADGMGGLAGSGQVSETIVNSMLEAYAPGGEETAACAVDAPEPGETSAIQAPGKASGSCAPGCAGISPARQLQLLFRQAQARVDALLSGGRTKSGSTVVACIVKDQELSWLAVGDSRIYLWRAGGVVQLNQDHDFARDLTMLAMQGEMTFAEADRDPRRESLTSYVGAGFPRRVEFNREAVRLLPGDKILLVSDGVYRALSQKEMADALLGSAEQAAKQLQDKILQKSLPQQDNFTAIILDITEK